MTEEPRHILEVLFLVDQVGIVSLSEHCGIDVVPLLETEYALSSADASWKPHRFQTALAMLVQTQPISG